MSSNTRSSFDRQLGYIGTAKPEEMAEMVNGALDGWRTGIGGQHSLASLWSRAYASYYAAARTLGTLGITGRKGEWVDGSASMNEYGNLARLLVAVLTAELPHVRCVARNSDARSMAQAQLGNIGIKAVWDDVHFNSVMREAVVHMVNTGTAWILQRWNPNAGEIVSVDKKGRVVHAGGIEMRAISPVNVAFNPRAERWGDRSWAIVSFNESRVDMQAAYPEFADELEEIGTTHVNLLSSDTVTAPQAYAYDPEAVTVNLFLHPRTTALPEGRATLCCGDHVLEDGPLQSRYTGLVRMVPEYISNTPFGYTHMFDTLAGQQCVDATMTQLLTSGASQSRPVVLMSAGSYQDLVQQGSLDVLFYAGDREPKLLAGNPVQRELFEMLNQLREGLERQSGVNGIDRGEPQASLKSGSALAFIQGQSKQFLGGLTEAIRQAVEACGNTTLALLQSYADTKRVAALVGVANEPLLQQWVGTEDLADVPRVVTEQVSGILGQMAGREQAASTLLANNMIKDPQKYIEFLNTGQIHSLTEQSMRSQLFVRMENESLMRGEPIRALLTDDHYSHISAHQTITEDPKLRAAAIADPEGAEAAILEACIAHMQEHINILGDPAVGNLLAALGTQPVMPTEGGNMTGATLPTENPGEGEPLPPEQPMPATDAQAVAGGEALAQASAEV